MNKLFYCTKPESIALGTDCSILRLPLVRQSTNYTCGIACVQSILRYGGYDFDIREDELAEILKSNYEDGTGYHNIVEYLNSVRYSAEEKCDHNIAPDGVQVFKAEARENISLEQLMAFIDEGKPVICAIQAWGNQGEKGDYSDIWEEGHYVIAIGYDKNNIFFMDPSTMGSYAYIPKEEFMLRWHDEDMGSRINQFGIIVTLSADYDQIKAFRMR
ncbi:MAG: C39 family peptidase [Eubacteriales bacterium]|nr:C39 family peptidase [Eubacteriales bacterium]